MLCLSTAVVFGILAGSAAAVQQPWELVVRVDPSEGLCALVSFRSVQIHKDLVGQNVIEKVTQIQVPQPGITRNVLRFLSYDIESLVSQAQLHCSLPDFSQYSIPSQTPFYWHESTAGAHILDAGLPQLELVPLITSGPADNRIDLAFFADGYTAGERQKFLDDASRLARDMSANQTFFTVKPLLNFWAVFTPSNESGIGVGGKAKDTPFGLYRDGTELRGLYANNSDVALAACAHLGDKCDYTILLANDPLYGGLGGEYTTTTASLANGALVLRHEIGHSIIEVGEEYDGGFAYFGVNAIYDPEDVTWAHWLTHKNDARAERSVMPMQAYPWTLLDVAKPWSITFSSTGTYARHLIKFSLSGIPHVDDLVVYLDGVDLGWTPRDGIGFDRWHYDVPFGHGLAGGEHVVQFVLRNREIQGKAQLCSVEVLEYGSLEEFEASPGYYSLFPTYDLDNATSYRPTNDDCLMRTVVNSNLCNVCLEGLWLSLLKRVDLIEDLRLTCSGSRNEVYAIQVELVKLAQFREEPIESTESYAIEWSRNGEVLSELANLTHVELSDAEHGAYRVHVVYAIDQVRLDPRGYLHASRTIEVAPYPCGSVIAMEGY